MIKLMEFSNLEVIIIKILNGRDFFNAFVHGTNEVIKTADTLNKINVFPVADGDTGTNLSSTLQSVIELSRVSDSFGETVWSMADSALLSARGNSGAIFAQYFHGMSKSFKNHRTVDVITFAEGAFKAIDYAYDAMSVPTEGTMLTVIKEWSRGIYKLRNLKNDFKDLFISAFDIARTSLKKTPEKLNILKRAGVVDAGAQGFVSFLEGMKKFIEKGKSNEKPILETNQINTNFKITIDEDYNYKDRFCTEANIYGNSNIDREKIKSILDSYGSSSVIVGSENLMHIHVHTNYPADLFTDLRSFGKIKNQKIDDMKMQYFINKKKKFNIALVTDSTCDIPQKIIDDYQIQVVPLIIDIEGADYLDKVTLHPAQFYNLLEKTKKYPTTSQPGERKFHTLYSFLSSHYDSIISVHLTQKFSGIFQSSKKASERIKNKKIDVIDSKQVSGSLGLLVIEAARMIEKGFSHDKIVEEINKTKNNIRTFVAVNTLKYFVKGGRVSPLKGVLAKAMNLKPIVSMDCEGNSILIGKEFSRKKSIKRILQTIDYLNKDYGIISYNINHAHDINAANELSELIEKMINKKPEYIMDISPVVGLNSGIGAVSINLLFEKNTWTK